MKGLMIIIGASSVIVGAFGAHVLKPMLSVKNLSIFQTASTYHLIYAVFILALFLCHFQASNRWLKRSFYCAVTGVSCFSGSLYLIAVRSLIDIEKLMPIVGPITPIGGLLMIGSWLLLWPALSTKKMDH